MHDQFINRIAEQNNIHTKSYLFFQMFPDDFFFWITD